MHCFAKPDLAAATGTNKGLNEVGLSKVSQEQCNISNFRMSQDRPGCANICQLTTNRKLKSEFPIHKFKFTL